MVQRELVGEAYRVLLGRDPVEPAEISASNQVGDELQLIRNLARRPAALERLGLFAEAPHPLQHLNSSIDVKALIKAAADPNRQKREGYFVNFQGVAVPIEVHDNLIPYSGRLDHLPIPANFHADMAEWGAALRAVQLARGSFTMIELGSGWGCWMSNTGVPAKRRGLKTHVIGVEGDTKHIELCDKAMAANGIAPDEYTVFRGIAAAGGGYALFPERKDQDHWGYSPKFGLSEEESREAVESGDYQRLPMIPLAEVIGDRPYVDLLHIDIQGGEADLIRDTLPLLTEKVGYILIGTHSRVLEGRIMEMLQGDDWALEVERPAIFNIIDGREVVYVDGVQAWRNRHIHG